MKTLITFDVKDKLKELRSKMLDNGYELSIFHNGFYHFLPEQALIHGEKSPGEVLKEIQMICDNLNIELDRCFAIEISNWTGIVGESGQIK